MLVVRCSVFGVRCSVVHGVRQVKATGQKPFISISLNDGQMCNCPPTPNNYSSMNANEHTFSYVSRSFYEHRFDKDAMLGYGQEPPTPWRPCCWLTGNASCAASCPAVACAFSWMSPVPRKRLIALVAEVSAMYAPRGKGLAALSGILLVTSHRT